MTARLVTLAVLCAMLALPVTASAQDPFGPVPPAPAPEQPQEPPPSPDQDDDGLSSTQQLLIGLSGFVLLVGIGWAIVRDARKAAPVDSRGYVPEQERPSRTRKPPAKRVQAHRRAEKAARKARRRNR